MTDAIAIKQQLLAQYDMLQSRIKDLKDATENEVCGKMKLCCSTMFEWIIDYLINIVGQEDDLKLFNDVILFMASFILEDFEFNINAFNG